jgi:hypothetical protein
MPRARVHRKVGELPLPKNHHPRLELAIRENGLRPYVLCDSRACYWHPQIVRTADQNYIHISEGMNEQLIRMMLDGAFGESAKEAVIDGDRWQYIYDNLIDVPIDRVIESEALRLLELFPAGNADGAPPPTAADPGTVGWPTTGPSPTSWSGTVSRNAERPSSTYVFGARDLWKVGHATNVTDRLAEVNKHVPHEVLQEKWQIVLQHPSPTEADAYAMEQRVLRALRTPTCVGERVSCTRETLYRVWASARLTTR